MNVFTRSLGVTQGRIKSGGGYVYELGHAALEDGIVNVGDLHQIEQVFVKQPESTFIRAQIVVTTPAILPAGNFWEVSAWLNGTRQLTRRLKPSKRKILLEDWAVSLRAANAAPATNTLAFRLELV
jgi:hypothetical protein